MSTYITGVQDYIPQFQPYQMDLNFYANVLQTKQTQYDSNWKALNNAYGQLFYSDLSRQDTSAKRDELLKQVDFNLKRVSGLDLSLEQNARQASMIFKPFYEDKLLMKDMAFTKNYMSKRSRAEGLKNSQDAEQRKQYWETGVKAMDYMREEFTNASADKALNFRNVEYTPYVNTMDLAMKLSKEAGLSMESVSFSPDGKWIVKTKNGDQLMEPLNKLFESQLGSDPAVQAVYRTQAYVNRKDYAYSNAGLFGGDVEKAELKYLENNYNILKEQNKARYEALKSQSSSYDSKIAALKKDIESGKSLPGTEKTLRELEQGRDINNSILQRIENEEKDFEDKTVTTSTGFKNPYGDIESLRMKVDASMASMLMNKDLDEAAQIFAFRDAKQDVEANPYAVKAEEHKYRMSEINAQGQWRMKAVQLRNAGERQNMLDKSKLESGAYYQDPQTGEVRLIEDYDNSYVVPSDKGSAVGEMNQKSLSREKSRSVTENIAVPYVNQMLASLSTLRRSNKISDKELFTIINGEGDKRKYSFSEFKQKLDANPYEFLRGELGTEKMKNIHKRYYGWMYNHSGMSEVSDQLKSLSPQMNKFKDYVAAIDADDKWRKKTSKVVEQELIRNLPENQQWTAKYLYDETGRLRTQAEFETAIIKQASKSGNKKIINDLIFLKAAKLAERKDMNANRAITTALRELGLANATSSGKLQMGVGAAQLGLAQVQDYIGQFTNYMKFSGVKKAAKSMLMPDYDDLVKQAGDAYSNSKVIKEVSPLVGLTKDPGSGLYVPGIQKIDVAQKAYGTKGNIFFNQAIGDLRSIDMNDITQNVVSIDGPTKTAFDKAKEEDFDLNTRGSAFINALSSQFKNTKSKLPPFSIGYQAIAGGSTKKSAMIIYPDAEFLSKYTGKVDKDGNRTNLFTPEEAQKIMSNGLSVMSDSKNWNNGLAKSSEISPIEAIINSDPENGYTWHDYRKNPVNGDPMGSFNIRKNPYGTNDYITSMTYQLWNPETQRYETETKSDFLIPQGNNIEALRDKAYDYFEIINQQNLLYGRQ